MFLLPLLALTSLFSGSAPAAPADTSCPHRNVPLEGRVRWIQ